MKAHHPTAAAIVAAFAILVAPAFARANPALAIDASAFVRTAAEKKEAKEAKEAKAAPAARPAAKDQADNKAATDKVASRPAGDKAASRPAGDKAAVAKAEPGKKDAGKKTAAKKNPEEQKPGPLADFGAAEAPADVVHVANWASYTRNHRKKAFVIIDKKQARLYVFDPKGKLKSSTPVLLGKAIGDHTAPGVGNKPLSQMKEEEKTTPAGRFLASPGRNTSGEDILWIDYHSAVSMHRLRKVAAEERRAERMATEDVSDNRISNGCVNVPPRFYNTVLKPTVLKQGAYVYVLPETRSPQQVFGSFDVPRDGNAKG